MKLYTDVFDFSDSGSGYALYDEEGAKPATPGRFIALFKAQYDAERVCALIKQQWPASIPVVKRVWVD